MNDTNATLLKVSDLVVHYGGILALNQVMLEVRQNEIISVIGANGAGKSTLLKTLAGLKAPTSGQIEYAGMPLPRNTYQIVRNGVVLVPEGRRIFAPLTVMENLRLGAYTRSNPAEFQETLGQIFALFPVLEARATQPAGTLSGGEQQMLAVGRALMSNPRLLMLDEPSLGLAPLVIDTLFNRIVQLNMNGLTILLVEQNASLALEISHRAYVLETGNVRYEGKGSDLLEDPRVRESYLGIKGG